MNTYEWLEGVRRWLRKHPLKEPPVASSYTEEVMRRLRPLAFPAPAIGWWARSRAVMALTAAVAGMMALAIVPHTPRFLANQLAREWDLLEQAGGEMPLDETHLDEELSMTDTFMLAESGPESTDDAWMTQTLELLDEAGGDVGASGTPTDKEFEDLQWMESLEAIS